MHMTGADPCRHALPPSTDTSAVLAEGPELYPGALPLSKGVRRRARCTQLVPLPSDHQHSVGAVAAGPELYKGWLSGRLRRGGRGGRRRSVPSEALAEALGHLVDHLHILLARGAERVAHLLQRLRKRAEAQAQLWQVFGVRGGLAIFVFACRRGAAAAIAIGAGGANIIARASSATSCIRKARCQVCLESSQERLLEARISLVAARSWIPRSCDALSRAAQG